MFANISAIKGVSQEILNKIDILRPELNANPIEVKYE